MEKRTKKNLAVALSRIKGFENHDLMEEQYMTDSETAADICWNAMMLGDVEGKNFVDLGAGTGILSIGFLLLGANKATLVEKDKDALKIAESNLDELEMDATLLNVPISGFKGRADVVIQNPPFGTKVEHADKEFLLKAFKTSDVVYSIHKSTTDLFVKSIAKESRFEITHIFPYSLLLKMTQKFHKKEIHRIGVNCYRLAKI